MGISYLIRASRFVTAILPLITLLQTAKPTYDFTFAVAYKGDWTYHNKSCKLFREFPED